MHRARRMVALALGALLSGACSSQATPTLTTTPPPASLRPSPPVSTAAPTAQASPSPWLSLTDPGWTGAAWSPDSRWLMVWRQPMNGPASEAQLLIDRPDGSSVQRFTGVVPDASSGFDPTWLDATHFVVAQGGRAVMGTVGSVTLVPFAPLAGLGLTSNGRGALAWVDATSSVSASAARWVVSTTSGSTTPRLGIPQGWSHDGTRLVVWHWRSGEGPETLGWLEIVSWPGLRTIAAFPNDLAFSSTAAALFDLTDRYFLGEDARLHDLVTGAKTAVLWSGKQVVDARWNAADQLVGANLTDGRAIAYDVAGHQVFETGPIGDDISGSVDGSILGLWFGDTGGATLTLLSTSGQRQLAAPGPVQSNVLFAPNGSGLVIGSSGEPLLLRQP